MTCLPRFLLLFAFLGGASFARPLDTDDTGTVARGNWEVEGGVDFVRAGSLRAFAVTPVAAYGVTDRLQFDFACDYLVEMESGAPDVHSLNPALQFKWLAWEHADAGLSFGVKGNIGRPVHVRGPQGGDDHHGHLRLLFTKEVGATAFDFNAGYDFTGAWGDGDDSVMTSVAVRRAVSEQLTVLGEIVGTHPERGGRSEGMIAAGFKYSARGGWHWDALVGTGLGRDGADFRLVIGFVREI